MQNRSNVSAHLHHHGDVEGKRNKEDTSGNTSLLDDKVNGTLDPNLEITNEELFGHALRRYHDRNDTDLARNAPDEHFLAELLIQSESLKSIELIEKVFQYYGDRPCMGYRDYDVNDKKEVFYRKSLHTFTYKQVWTRIQYLATGLRHYGVRPGSMIGICGIGSVDYAMIDLACIYLGATAVLLQTTFSESNMKHVVNETELSLLLCSTEQANWIPFIVNSCSTIQHAILFDVIRLVHDNLKTSLKESFSEDIRDFVTVHLIDEVVELGSNLDTAKFSIPGLDTDHADPLLKLVYTSGSTGVPKGALYTERVISQLLHSTLHYERTDFPIVTFLMFPLNHTAGQFCFFRSLMQGGRVYFMRASDLDVIFEDVRLVRPTYLALVPRMSEHIYLHFQDIVAQRLSTLKEADRSFVEQSVREELRFSYLGDRMISSMTGSAPLTRKVLNFLRNTFEIPVIDFYGATENLGVMMEHRLLSPPVTAYKLVDAPEQGYSTHDKPFPRGELLVQSSTIIPGYYKRPGIDLRDSEGFMHTGDIFEERANGELHLVDRRGNVMKLAQGEFVSPSFVQGVLSGSSYISQIYVHGSGSRSFLLAVIVPNVSLLHRQLGDKINNESDVKSWFRSELSRVASEAKLRPLELPRDFIIEWEPFTEKNHLLTESGKQARGSLKSHYGARLERMFDDIELRTIRAAASMKRFGGDGDADEGKSKLLGKETDLEGILRTALAATFGFDSADIDISDSRMSFVNLGGDSLSAVRFVAIIKSATGVNLPMTAPLNPSLNLKALLGLIKSGGGSQSHELFLQLHGENPTTIYARDLKLEKFIPELETGRLGTELLSSATDLLSSATDRVIRNVLLTGATGFLGRFLLLDLLQTLPSDGKVTCIVRAQNESEGFERLCSSFFKSGPYFVERFKALASPSRLCVLVGDLHLDRFGLSEHVFNDLVNEIDCILHCAAFVNHKATYAELFEANVVSTVQLMRLAITGRIKAFSFVSTIGVSLAVQRTDGGVYEDEIIDEMLPSRPATTDEYASGYATSKWACEVLLKQLHARCKVPVTISRPSMILAHRTMPAQVNAPDMLTRLLFGIIHTGLAPKSFYARDESTLTHYDGVPVDIVAASIRSIALHSREDGRHSTSFTSGTYHIVNDNWNDDVSLDSFVLWCQSLGYRIEIVPSHAEWFKKFSDSLQNLDNRLQQRSPLALLPAWSQPLTNSGTMVDTARFRSVRNISKPPLEVPVLDESYMHKYLRDMMDLDLIPQPLHESGSYSTN